MAAQTYGTVHLWGIDGTVTNATLTGMDFDSVCKNVAEVVDEIGNEIERRYDDIHDEGTLTLIQRESYAVPVPGTTIADPRTVDPGADFEITAVGRKYTAKGHRIVELKVKRSEYIAS